MEFKTTVEVVATQPLDEGFVATCADATDGQGEVSFGSHFHLICVEDVELAKGTRLEVTLTSAE